MRSYLARAILLCALLWPDFGTASPGVDTDQATPEVLLLVPRCSPNMAERVRRAIESQLSDLPVRLEQALGPPQRATLDARLNRVRQIAMQRPSVMILWVDHSDLQRVYYYRGHHLAERLYVRQVPSLGSEGTHARLEAVALVVRSLVQAFISGRQPAKSDGDEVLPVLPGPPQPEGSEPRPAVATSSTEPASRESPGLPDLEETGEAAPPPLPRLLLSVAYGGVTYARRAPLGHLASVIVAVRFAGPLHLLAAYHYEPPLQMTTESLTLRVTRYPLLLGAHYNFTLPQWKFGAAVLAVTSHTRVGRRDLDPALEPRGARTGWEFSVATLLRASWLAQPRVGLTVGLLFEVPLNRPAFVVERNSARETILHPWPLRIGAQFGASFWGF